jgi:hypothetical protein
MVMGIQLPTSTEQRIIQERKGKATGASLVPILEELLERECIPEDEEDFRFLDMLVHARALPRAKGVFSPSMLGSCIRQAYFSKRGVEKHHSASPQMNGYFLKGNFIHFQWQFACWKAHRAGMLELVSIPIDHEIEIVRHMFQSGDNNHSDRDFVQWLDALDFNYDGTRPGVEVRVLGEEDFGGTIDVLLKIIQTHVIDFKGIRLDDFMKTVRKGAPVKYRKQLVGYVKNVNASGILSEEVESALLISECKAGPVSGVASPLALHETVVYADEYEGEVNKRLRTLRWFDGRDETPPPECKSTLHMQFKECPFNRLCRDEVKRVQREREAKARRQPPKDWDVARSRR